MYERTAIMRAAWKDGVTSVHAKARQPSGFQAGEAAMADVVRRPSLPI
jgi:hypothetical protein